MAQQLEADPADRRIKSMVVSVPQALDLLRLQGEDRRAVRERWRLNGWIDRNNRVDLALAGPAMVPRQPARPPAPARAKRRPPAPARQTAAQRREEETWASDLDRDFYYRRRGIFHG
ncbi:hypothetical protein KBY84_12735 [Cyanobium sp. N.Huapi 1H5]|uniref:hypothetical protein n=1 Tax=Cyanobium sp. N.Huapi 1H5 TaxID=2823719 RepID=UPI0020CE7F4B|nr:hypothetical protein [Cyanobium sp. N.Huapi 1H5]MCP9838360.1 hypothetical protein [Cyanobium sp. N.Huapi 1H5]